MNLLRALLWTIASFHDTELDPPVEPVEDAAEVAVVAASKITSREIVIEEEDEIVIAKPTFASERKDMSRF